jgi:hypothetical protein
MRVIEEAKKKAYFSDGLMSDMRLQSIENAHGAGFQKGFEFANKWYSSKRKDTPVNKILLCKVEDFYIVGFFDGNKWVNDSSREVENVTHWRLIF